jgi:hypothetical protein
MTLEDFLTLSLPSRIAWLHSEDGPHGRLSHDRFAAMLGTNRQTVISWENGVEPTRYADRLAEFSGFPASAFRRRQAEALAARLNLSHTPNGVGAEWLSLVRVLVQLEHLSPELRAAAEAAADELETSGHAALEAAAAVRERLSRETRESRPPDA